eukprot:scaffold1.g5301.t1
MLPGGSKPSMISFQRKRRRESQEEVLDLKSQASPPPASLPPAARAQQPPAARRPSLLAREAEYFQQLDREELLETDELSRQTTPAGSHATSPTAWGPAAAAAPHAQAAAASLQAWQQQQQQRRQLSDTEEVQLGTKEIRKHYPRAAEQYDGYLAFAHERRLQPLRLSEFFASSGAGARGAPVL